MDHLEKIQAAFFDQEFQATVGTVMQWAPELKHETVINTMLSCVLRKNGVPSRREVKEKKIRRSRRFDLMIGNIPLETKYQLDFDVDCVRDTVRGGGVRKVRSKQDKSSWSAGDAFLNELHRAKHSYFLWMVCDRGPNPPDDVCMKPKADKWLQQLPQRTQQNSRDHVRSTIHDIREVVKSEFTNISVWILKEIQCKSSVLHSTLFFRG